MFLSRSGIPHGWTRDAAHAWATRGAGQLHPCNNSRYLFCFALRWLRCASLRLPIIRTSSDNVTKSDQCFVAFASLTLSGSCWSGYRFAFAVVDLLTRCACCCFVFVLLLFRGFVRVGGFYARCRWGIRGMVGELVALCYCLT